MQLHIDSTIATSPEPVRHHSPNYLEQFGAESKQLHLGCFDSPVDGWVNTDITPHIWITRVPLAARALHLAGRMSPERLAQHRNGIFRRVTYLNVAKKFPYQSGSFRAIFSCHMLEHLYPPVATHCIRECCRVLRHRGVLRIVIPDLDRIVSRYDPKAPESFLQSVFEYGRGLKKNSHHWHYNFCSLKTALLKAGFSRVERREFQVGDCPDVVKLDRRPESLFVEAYKY
jgi:SAM-dependent methyltransferase